MTRQPQVLSPNRRSCTHTHTQTDHGPPDHDFPHSHWPPTRGHPTNAMICQHGRIAWRGTDGSLLLQNRALLLQNRSLLRQNRALLRQNRSLLPTLLVQIFTRPRDAAPRPKNSALIATCGRTRKSAAGIECSRRRGLGDCGGGRLGPRGLCLARHRLRCTRESRARDTRTVAGSDANSNDGRNSAETALSAVCLLL